MASVTFDVHSRRFKLVGDKSFRLTVMISVNNIEWYTVKAEPYSHSEAEARKLAEDKLVGFRESLADSGINSTVRRKEV